MAKAALKTPKQPPSPVNGQEHISPLVQLLCDTMRQARIRRVYELPPVFLASTYDEAESMMEIFTEFYLSTKGSPGPVGFGTETTSNFVTKQRGRQEVSLIQLATQDVCLLFQIYSIMSLKQKQTMHFPPRLRVFLENPNQLMCGVGTDGDSEYLRKDYGVYCQGLVELSEMAAERNIPRRSLEALDAIYGRPGREVIKTKKALSWNWDKEVLLERWIWYAAKDAFGGLAIYENMTSGIVKSELAPSEKLPPMSKEEMTADILLFLAKSDTCGIGKAISMRIMVLLVAAHYPRFKRLYKGPSQREQFARRHVGGLIREGKIIVSKREKDRGGDPTKNVANSDKVMIPKVMHTLRTVEGIRLAASFFNHPTLDPSAMTQTGVTTTTMEDGGDQDLYDLRMFLEFSHLWDRPLVLKDLVDYYMQSVPRKRNPMNTSSRNQRSSTTAAASQYPTLIDVTPLETSTTLAVSEVLTNFLIRLLNRKVIVQQGRFYEVESKFRKGLMALLTISKPSTVQVSNQ